MRLVYNNPGGIIPKLADTALPQEAATEAKNIDFSAGGMQPLVVTGPLNSMHDDDGNLKAGLTTKDVAIITKPAQPSTFQSLRMCKNITSWVRIARYVFKEYNDADGTHHVSTIQSAYLTPVQVRYSKNGFVLTCRHAAVSETVEPGIPIKVHGPKYAFGIDKPSDPFDGGPSENYVIPSTGAAVFSDPPYPGLSVPLVYPIDMDSFAGGYTPPGSYSGETHTYANLELVDVRHQEFDEEYSLPDTATSSASLKISGAGYTSFIFRLDYVQDREQFYYYLASAVDQTTATGECNDDYSGAVTEIVLKSVDYPEELTDTGVLVFDNGGSPEYVEYTAQAVNGETYEFTVSATLAGTYSEDDTVKVIDPDSEERLGPISEESVAKSADPGEILFVQSPTTDDYYKHAIWRSSDNQNFALAGYVKSGEYFCDDFVGALGFELPPYGNLPHSTVAEALQGSQWHPGNFAVFAYGDTLYLSDPFRPWACPLEYTVGFPTDIMAWMVVGSSIVVWTEATATQDGRTFRVVGQDPRAMARFEITDVQSLSSVLGLCKIGQVSYYVSSDGLIAVDESGQWTNITDQYVTRATWAEWLPSIMMAYSDNDSVYLMRDGATSHLRFQLGKDLKSLTTFTEWANSEFDWTSGIRVSPQKIKMSHLRVEADDYPVAVHVYVDDMPVVSRLVNNSNPCRIKITRPGKKYQLRAKASARVQEIVLATNAIETKMDLSEG